MSNQPPLVFALIILCFIFLLGMIVYEIYTDIKYSLYKRALDKKVNDICPQCKGKLKIQNVSKDNYGDIDYFTYCNKCDTIYKIKYKEL